jgi:exodeoxyribonuclease-3
VPFHFSARSGVDRGSARLKIATWNVNSLRVRLAPVLEWLERHRPEVLALQETKVPDAEFPSAAFEAVGYRVVFNGQKTYNGVAVLSRSLAEDCVTDPPNLIDDPQRRILAVTVDGIRVVNLYVPNGSEVGSEKYAYKLDWLARIQAFLSDELVRWPAMVVLGDFNIAPEDRDVYDPEAWRERILCSTPERTALRRLMDLPLCDAFRSFEQPEGCFSWWDYRTAAFRRNHGLRIDLILISAELRGRLRACNIDTGPRKLERPSDHTPVWAEFDPAT